MSTFLKLRGGEGYEIEVRTRYERVLTPQYDERVSGSGREALIYEGRPVIGLENGEQVDLGRWHVRLERRFRAIEFVAGVEAAREYAARHAREWPIPAADDDGGGE